MPLSIHADLDLVDARALTGRLRDAAAVRRRIGGGIGDLILRQIGAAHGYAGDSFQIDFNAGFLPRIAAAVRLEKDRVLLEIHGGNARARLWMDYQINDALVFDLERSITDAEGFQ